MQARGKKTAYRVKTISQSRYKSCPRDIWQYWSTREKPFPRGFLSCSMHALQTVVNHIRIWKNIKTRLDNRIGSMEAVFWRSKKWRQVEKN